MSKIKKININQTNYDIGEKQVEITNTNTEPTDPDVQLWVNLGSTSQVNIPEINDGSTSVSYVWSANKINSELSGKQATLVVGTNLDNTPTQNSTNPITSGAVYSALGDINSVLEEVL